MSLASLPDDWNLDEDLLVLMGAGAETQLATWRKLGIKRGLAIIPEGVPSRTIEGVTVAKRIEELKPFVWETNVPFRRISMRLTHEGGVDKTAASLWLTTLGSIAEEHRSFHQTMAHLGHLWAGNGLQNATHLAASPMIGDYGDVFKGVPMIVVGAGPSLAKNIQTIKDAKGKAIVVAVHRALESLHRAGIVPDLTIAIEARDVRHQFEDVGIANVAATLLSTTVAPNLQDHGAQRTIYFTSQSREHWLLGQADRHHEALSLGTVSHSAVSLGKVWGCDPIIMVGQDLAFTGGDVYHRDGADGATQLVDAESSGHCKLAGFGPERGKTLNGNEHASFNVVEVPAINGGTVLTSTSFNAFRQVLEIMARDWAGSTTLLNCTEGGAHIEGWTNAVLSQVVTKLPSRSLDVAKALDDNRDPSAQLRRSQDVMSILQKTRSDLGEVMDLSAQCVGLIDRFLKKPSPKIMRKLEPRENRLKEVSKGIPALTLATHHDMTIIASQTSGVTDLEGSLRLSLRMYQTIHDHAKSLLDGTYAR